MYGKAQYLHSYEITTKEKRNNNSNFQKSLHKNRDNVTTTKVVSIFGGSITHNNKEIFPISNIF